MPSGAPRTGDGSSRYGKQTSATGPPAASSSFTPATPPAQVYIELWDREANRRVRSASVVPTPSVGTTIAGVVVNDRDSDLNTLDPGEALSGVTIQLIVDTNADGVIDAGEVTWATTTTNGSGAYSFSDLWQRNYIVRAVSPSNFVFLYNTASLSGAVKTGGVGVAGALVTAIRCRTAAAAPSPPVAGACTLKHGSPVVQFTDVETDASGNYTISGLLEGIYQIEVAPATAGYSNVVVPGGAGFYLAVLRGDGDNAVVPDFRIN